MAQFERNVEREEKLASELKYRQSKPFCLFTVTLERDVATLDSSPLRSPGSRHHLAFCLLTGQEIEVILRISVNPGIYVTTRQHVGDNLPATRQIVADKLSRRDVLSAAMLRLLREHMWVPNGRIAQSSSPLSGTFLRSTHVFPIESLSRGGLPAQPTRVRRKAVSVPALPRRQAGGLRSVAALQKSLADAAERRTPNVDRRLHSKCGVWKPVPFSLNLSRLLCHCAPRGRGALAPKPLWSSVQATDSPLALEHATTQDCTSTRL
ncbi:hypothetical protein LSAT2_012785 [Lamellibrachia satsuma]|nr:hypothetical protein LSAT2_012785 [Lamellibrachia satsuma]